tara:strand:+ start:439 stop:690 length:252 start_codon:yes stop_codon:yes gene_type:complete
MELSSFANMLKENEISIKIIKRILNICLIGFFWLFYLIPKYTRIWGVIFKNVGILIEAIIVDGYSISSGDCQITTSNFTKTSK